MIDWSRAGQLAVVFVVVFVGAGLIIARVWPPKRIPPPDERPWRKDL